MKIKLPNFSSLSLSRGEIAEIEGGRKRNLGKQLKNVAVWGLAGTFFFTLFAWLSLPTRALAWRISHEAKQAGYVVDVEDLSVSPFGGITLENVTWTFEPSRPDMPPSKFFLEEVDIDVSLLSLLVGTLDVEVEAEREEGRIWGEYVRETNKSTFKFKVEDLPLYDLPKARQALNAPLVGIFALDLEIEMPDNKFGDANGFVEISCSGCRIGDNETKLYVPGSKAFQEGVTIPEIDLGTLTGRLTVEDGVAKIEDAIETESDDLRVQLTGSFNLKDPFARSRFKMVLKVWLNKTLQDRSEKIRLLAQTASEKTRLEGAEAGGLGFKLEGPASAPRFIGINTKSAAERRAERRAKQREREEKRAAAKAKRDAAKRSRATPKEEPTDADEEEKSDEDEGGDADGPPPLNVEPLEPPEPAEEPEPVDPAGSQPVDNTQPALPPPGGDDGEIEVFDPNDPGSQPEELPPEGGQGDTEGNAGALTPEFPVQ